MSGFGTGGALTSWRRVDGGQDHHDEPAVGPFGLVVTGTSLAFLVAAVVWPQAAEMLLRILVVAVACGFVLARAHRAGLPERMTDESFSPFRSRAEGPGPRAVPLVVRAFGEEVRAADHPRVARRTEIPWVVARTVGREVSRRLAEHHGLRLDRREHHPRIRGLLSEPTWHLVAPTASEEEVDAGTSSYGSVPLSRLEPILDDLERL
ncbi:MAG: hypothetical protein PVI57_09550 [Gemmatimonadota bacterium]